MKKNLFHGTSKKMAEKIKIEGLVPRIGKTTMEWVSCTDPGGWLEGLKLPAGRKEVSRAIKKKCSLLKKEIKKPVISYPRSLEDLADEDDYKNKIQILENECDEIKDIVNDNLSVCLTSSFSEAINYAERKDSKNPVVLKITIDPDKFDHNKIPSTGIDYKATEYQFLEMIPPSKFRYKKCNIHKKKC
jgi:hypothetical protein